MKSRLAPAPTGPDPEFLDALQRLLRHTRDNRKELASDLEIHPSTLSRWLNGRTLPTPEDRERLLSLLKQRDEVSLRRLVQKYGDASPGARAAVHALLEGGIGVWDAFDPITRDEILRLVLEIDGE